MDQLCMEQAVVKGLHLHGTDSLDFMNVNFLTLWKIEYVVWNGL